MRLIKWCLRVLVFIAMFLAWYFAMFLVMIYFANFFKQWYFLLDVKTFLDSPINSPNINFSIFTWLLFVYNFIFSGFVAFLYTKDSVSVKPSQFAIGNRETTITLVILASLIFIIILGLLFKKSIYSNLVIKSFIKTSDIIKAIITVIPISLFFNWFLDKSFLVVHLLSSTVYKKFGVNYFKVGTNNDLSFWAQNIGKRKNKFTFKGICRLDNFAMIRKKKMDSELLLKNPTDSKSWIELAPQDTMPIQLIKGNWLCHFIGFFDEMICIIYEGADEKLYRENLYLKNCDNNLILYQRNKKLDYVDLICILMQAIFIYFGGVFYSFVFLYTLSFVLVLFVGMHFIIQEVIREKNNNTVSLAIKSDVHSDDVYLQMKNNTLKGLCLNLRVLDDNEKTLLEQKDICINENAISSIIFFSKKYIKFDDPNVNGWKIELQDANNKKYQFNLRKDSLL